ncbi:MAG: diguanylate cyclase, partial [Oscillospiraceae bacterium]
RRKNGELYPSWLTISAVRNHDRIITHFVAVFADISSLKHAQAKLDYQAHHDPLTGLPNRRQFFDRLGTFETLYHTQGRDFAVIFLDLDNFKRANDLYGHKGGDELLIAAAGKLQACAGEEDFVARLGGDEFMVITPFTDTEAIDEKLQKIQMEFCKSVTLESGQYVLGISAGYDIFSQIGDITHLMQRADQAMYDDKKRLPGQASLEDI